MSQLLYPLETTLVPTEQETVRAPEPFWTFISLSRERERERERILVCDIKTTYSRLIQATWCFAHYVDDPRLLVVP
jgi:hypothetical protein